jgi:hypothetical protein
LHRAAIIWCSKPQNTVECSTFSWELIALALKMMVDMVQGMRHKLRIMGVPLEGSASAFCDNGSVVKSAANPEVTLRKRHAAIVWHKVPEAIVEKMVHLAKEPGETNLADTPTKLMSDPRLRELASRILW